MWLKKPILAPTDFGEASLAASRVALEFAQQYRVPLVLQHVYMVPYGGYVATVASWPLEDMLQAFEKAAREALEETSRPLLGKGAEVTTRLDEGVPWERILDAAKELDAGLIVMGTHGRRGLSRALLGSVAEKVLRLSPVPVLTIHEEPTSPPLPID